MKVRPSFLVCRGKRFVLELHREFCPLENSRRYSRVWQNETRVEFFRRSLHNRQTHPSHIDWLGKALGIQLGRVEWFFDDFKKPKIVRLVRGKFSLHETLANSAAFQR